MSRFVRKTEPIRIDLGDGDWVDLKSRFSMGDRAAINQSIVEGGVRSYKSVDKLTGEETERSEMGQMQLGASNIATMERGIIAWGGPGFCRSAEDHEKKGSTHYDDDENNGCKPIPINWKNLLDLDDPTGSKIIEEISKRNVQPSKEESANP